MGRSSAPPCAAASTSNRRQSISGALMCPFMVSTRRSARFQFLAASSSGGREKVSSALPSPSRGSSTTRTCWSIRCRWWRRESSVRSSSSEARDRTPPRPRHPHRISALSATSRTSPEPQTLYRADQHVPLLAERQLDHALRREIGERQQPLLVGDRLVVHLKAATIDLAARLARRWHEDDMCVGGENAPTSFQLRASYLEGRQGLRQRSLLEGRARGAFRPVRGFPPVQQRCGLGGEHLLRLVQLSPLQARQPVDLRQRHFGEQPEEAADIFVLGVPPIL